MKEQRAERRRRPVLTLAAAAVLAAGAAGATDPVRVVNKGIGGNTSRDGLRRFERDVLDVRPAHLILYFGINDACNSGKLVPVDAFRANMQQMIDRARAAGVRTVVLVTPNPVLDDYLRARHPRHPVKDLSTHLLQYDAAVRELASKNSLALADLRKLIDDHGGATEAASCLIRNRANSKSNDGVHLSAEGYRLMAGLFEPIFKGRVKPGDVVVCFGDSITYGAHMPGAGTAFGDTYPAWLSLVLNRLAGLPTPERPAAPPAAPMAGLLANGDFEASADRVHADGWSAWSVPGRQVGKTTVIADRPKSGSRCLRVVNAEPKHPAFVMSRRPVRVSAGRPYRLTFWARGAGAIRAVLLPYQKRKPLPGYPSLKDAPYVKAGAQWTQHTLDYTCPTKVTSLRVAFRATGTVDLDHAALTMLASAPKRAAHVLANPHMRLTFAPPSAGGALTGVRNAKNFEFLNAATRPGLWRLTLRRIPTREPAPDELSPLSLDPEQSDGGTSQADVGDGQVVELVSDTAKATAAKVEADKDGLTFTWTGIDVADEKAALDVRVEVVLRKDDPFARFRASFENRSKRYTVFYFAAPVVGGIRPADGKLERDRLALPCFTGRLVVDPIRNGILGKPTRFQPNRSGHSMQFDAYHHDRHGLYLGCFDGQQNLKRYRYTTDAKAGLSWAVVHVPNNMKRTPQHWSTPYETVARCFEGDWYDAARIYREWALEQTWTAEGPLVTRASTPTWFKEIDAWWLWGSQCKPLALTYDPKLLAALKGVNQGILCQRWGTGLHPGHHRTPDRFPLTELDRTYVGLARQHRFPILTYIQGVCWDMATESFKRAGGIDHTVRDFYGRRVVWDFSRGKPPTVCAIAWPGKVWTRVLGDVVYKMATEADFDAAYLDSNNHAGTYMNFNPLYGPDSGGGTAYIKANHAMVRAMRERVRRVKPGFCFTAESFWEGNMAVLDGFLTCNTTHRYLKAGEALAIPLAQAVYHDRTIMYSAWVGRHDLQENDAQGYIAKWGQAFVWGVKPAWNQPHFLLKLKNHQIAMASSVKRYRAYAASRKFLTYGRMLRPPKLARPAPQVEFKWYRAWRTSTFDVALPAVLRSMWRAPDGALGLVLYNITAKAQTIEVVLDDPEYGLKPGAPPGARAVYPTSAAEPPTLRRDSAGRLVLAYEVAPRSPAVFELTPGRGVGQGERRGPGT